MAPKQPPIVLPPGCTAESLVPVQQLLHLTAHRNKNQHRIAKWWSSFSILRRQVDRLVASLESPDAMFRAKKVEIEQRVTFLREEIVPRCYLAFSAVVADNQYASLGLMLMGCLARINKLISMPTEEEEAEEEVKTETATTSHVLHSEDFGEAISREELVETKVKTKKSLKTPKKVGDRTKEVPMTEFESLVETPRSDLSTTSRKVTIYVTETSEREEVPPSPLKPAAVEKKRKKVVEKAVTPTSSKTTTSKPVKKKRKKGGDEFDDLFSGLI